MKQFKEGFMEYISNLNPDNNLVTENVYFHYLIKACTRIPQEI